MHIRSWFAVAVAVAASAQSPIVIPNGLATTEGIAITAYPWGRGTAQIRVQYVYDTTHFSAQGITSPIVVTRLRWRANGGAVQAGGTYNLVTVQMGTCPTDHLAASATFANNLGASPTTVYAGPVVVAAGAGATPNNWYVDIPLTTPFVYDPTAGDLTFDFDTDASGWVGTAGPGIDCGTTGVNATRIYNLSNHASPTGTVQINVGIVTEIEFVGLAGAATVSSYGTGCNLPAPLTLAASARPIVGTTVTLASTNVPVGSALGATILSFLQLVPGIDLTAMGMPGCTQYVGIDAVVTFLPAGGAGSTPIPIPNNNAFSGVHFFAQSVAFAVGQNPLGLVASNALDLGVGVQ